MAFSNIETYTAEEIAKVILEMKPEDLRLISAKFNDKQLTAAVTALTPSQDREWQYKLIAIIQGLQTPPPLETVGRALTLTQILALLDSFPLIGKSEHGKILPLLVGLPHMVFMQLLMKANNGQLTFLKQESIAEPIQYQLAILCHELSRDMTGYSIGIENLARDIDAVSIEELTQEEFTQLTHNIEHTAELGNILLDATNRALLLAWNTNRTDLIATLSEYKELLIKMKSIAIGLPASQTRKPTGLYQRLQSKIDFMFNANGDALSDDDLAIEALAKLSVWYLKDYWEIGLLPEFKSSEALEPPKNKSEKERLKFNEKLFAEASSNLKKIGLSTVKDLKQKQIFSRSALKKYIESHQDLLR